MPIAYFADGQFSLVIGIAVASALGAFSAYLDDKVESADGDG